MPEKTACQTLLRQKVDWMVQHYFCHVQDYVLAAKLIQAKTNTGWIPNGSLLPL